MVARTIQGFESGLVPSNVTITGGTVAVNTTTPASGAYSLAFTGSFSNYRMDGLGAFTASASTDEFWLGFNYRREFPDPSSNLIMWSVQLGSDSFIQFILTTSGGIEVRRDTSLASQNQTLLGTIAAGVLTQDAWHFVAIRIKPHDSTGEVDVAIDGVSRVVLTNVDTLAGTASTARSFSAHSALGSSLVCRFDDLVTGDNTGSQLTGLPVPHQIEALRPTSDVAAGFTRSTGADNFALVDEAPVSGSDYVSSTVSTTKDEYGLANRTHTGSVLAVAAVAVGLNTDGGAATIKLGVKRSGSEDQSTAQALAAVATHVQHISHVDPVTGVAYTSGNVDALNLTLEVA